MRRLRGVLLSLCILGLLTAPASAFAGRHLLIGFDEDAIKWGDSGAIALRAQGLGSSTFRVTLPWQPGQTTPAGDQARLVGRAVAASPQVRVILAVFGPAADAPQTAREREQYCGFIDRALYLWPQIHDVVIWNEANKQMFWAPQFAGRANVSAARYEALLARCYDVLRQGHRVNLITSVSPHRGGASDSSPAAFIALIGKQYRVSHRSRPLFDTWGQNVYGFSNRERVATLHSGGALAEGDYVGLLRALALAFTGTAQTLPSARHPSLWYLEDGFQSVTRPKTASYSGRENVPTLPFLGALSQASQLIASIRLAYCQPAVGAYFNFLLADETRLAGWQSGLFYADWTQKPSYAPVASFLASLRAGRIHC